MDYQLERRLHHAERDGYVTSAIPATASAAIARTAAGIVGSRSHIRGDDGFDRFMPGRNFLVTQMQVVSLFIGVVPELIIPIDILHGIIIVEIMIIDIARHCGISFPWRLVNTALTGTGRLVAGATARTGLGSISICSSRLGSFSSWTTTSSASAPPLPLSPFIAAFRWTPGSLRFG